MSFERARLRKSERDKRGKRAKETEREIDRQTDRQTDRDCVCF